MTHTIIPVEIADLMNLIWPDWPRLDNEEPEDEKAFREVRDAAHRIHAAGYRIAVSPPISPGSKRRSQFRFARQ